VDFVLRGWPWEPVPESENQNKEASAEICEAAKFGFRVLSKSRWDQLKEEYIAYRGKLLEEIIEAQDAEVTVPVPLKDTHKSVHGPSSRSSTDALSKASDPTIDLSSPYPLNCLVFVRNIHPETNKTTLRTLFSTSFKKPITNNELQGDGLDYVDFNKGMDSVRRSHLRPSIVLLISSSVICDSPHPAMHKFSFTISPQILYCRLAVSTTLALRQIIARQPSRWKSSKVKGRNYIGRRYPKKCGGRPCRKRSARSR